MKTREEATKYGLSFPDTYLETRSMIQTGS